MSWSGRRVLVTGAGGFIGSHLAERLASEGAKVRAFVHYNARGDWGNLEFVPEALKRRLEVVSGDIRDPFFMREAVKGRDTVFHLAALIAIPFSYRSPMLYVESNVKGTLNVLQACLDGGVRRMVHTSTSEVYGTAQSVPITEDHPLVGQSPYAASKIGADQMAVAYHRSFGLPVVILRPFNTYGPRQSLRAVIPTIIGQALKGPRVLLGNTRPTRDLTYVGDTVEAFLRAGSARGVEGRVLQAGTGREISVGELARAILAQIRPDGRIVLDRQRVRPGASEVGRLLADPSRARRLLGWKPRTSLEDGLRRTIAWYRTVPSARVERYAV